MTPPRTRYARSGDASIAYQVGNPLFTDWWGRRQRSAASPGMARMIMEMISQTDLRAVLPTIRVPTLVTHQRDDVQEFLTGHRPDGDIDRVLATVLFTDIVGSTERAMNLGDGPWRHLLDEHNGLVRAGLHTGECELVGNDIAGIAVHIGARVMGTAEAGEVLASSTVKDLVFGSGLRFADRGLQAFKGVSDPWRVYALER